MNYSLIFLALLQAASVRHYWPVTVDALAGEMVLHTHVQVTGRVTLVRHELDGDLHIKLVGATRFIVAECIPQLPCTPPIVGTKITVFGISRYDSEHRWWEVHPVERITQ